MGLDGGKSLSTPGTQDITFGEHEDKEMLGEDSMYRGLAARINYMSQDRCDLQFANKAVSRHMSTPSKTGWQILLRIGKYIAGARRLVQTFKWGRDGKEIHGFGDSDWAGGRKNGKSTSGGVLKVNGHVVKTWSATQQTVALSSGGG